MTTDQAANKTLRGDVESTNTIEASIDQELEAKITERYGLSKMMSASKDEVMRLKQMTQPPEDATDPIRNIQAPKLDEPVVTSDSPAMTDQYAPFIDVKLHPLLDHEIPEALLNRYAMKDHVYYSKMRDKGLVFEDKGRSISAKSSDPDDIRAMMDLAKAKNWSKIKISGTEEFKREVWLAASMQGIAVEGYKPSPQDISLLEDAKSKTRNKIDFVEPEIKVNTPQAAAPQPPEQVQPAPNAPLTAPDTTIVKDEGAVLVAHGMAKYLNDAKNTNSYYVQTRDAQSAEKTVWGVDLERAIKDSGASIGDKVLIANEGQKLVIITVPVRGANGSVIGSEQKEALRNTWAIQKPTSAEIAIVAVANAKGAGPKVQAMIKQKMAVATSQLAAKGIEIPAAKVYDAKAGSLANKTAIIETDRPALLKPIPQPQIAPRR
jgi:hypothetical protein